MNMRFAKTTSKSHGGLGWMQIGKGPGGSKALVEKLVREIQKVQEQLRAQTAARQRAEGDAATAQHEAKAAVGISCSLLATLMAGFSVGSPVVLPHGVGHCSGLHLSSTYAGAG